MTRKLSLLLLLVFALLAFSAAGGVCAIWYVSTAGQDTNGGTSWAQPFRTVQRGLSAAAAAGGEVRVAQGVYIENVTMTAGVFLMGGYAGTGSQPDLRNPAVYETVLDGGARDVVLKVVGPEGPASATRVDGLTIRNGNIYQGAGGITASCSLTVSSCRVAGNRGGFAGGGLWLNGNSAEVEDCLVQGNACCVPGPTHGGGICSYAHETRISRCRVTGNTCECGVTSGMYAEGAGIYVYGTSAGLSFAIDGCVITGNRTLGASYGCGAAIMVAGTCTGRITNCCIAGNTVGSTSLTGGVAVDLVTPQPVSLINNTILDNKFAFGAGNVLMPVVKTAGVTTIANNIIARDSGGVMAIGPGASSVLSHNCLYGNQGADYTGIDAGPTDIHTDPQLAGGAVPWRLQVSSPCIDAGDDLVVIPEVPDIEGYPRVSAAHVDIGASEFQYIAGEHTVTVEHGSGSGTYPALTRVHVVADAPPAGMVFWRWSGNTGTLDDAYAPDTTLTVTDDITITASFRVPGALFVRPDGDDSANGLSWATAFRTITHACAAARTGDEVRVAAGAYPEQVTLGRGVALKGGYAYPAPRDDRDPKLHETIIQPSDPSLACVVAAAGAVVDGFTLRDGAYGVHVSCWGDAAIRGCSITNCQTGVLCDGALERPAKLSLSVSDCVIVGCGAGVECRGALGLGGVDISGCQVVGCDWGGIILQDVSGEVHDNLIARSSGDGLNWKGSSVGYPSSNLWPRRIASNAILGNTGSGVVSWDSRAVVSCNRIIGNGSDGVQVDGVCATLVISNVIAANGGNGITGTMNALNDTIVGNAAAGAGGTGAYIPYLRNCIVAFNASGLSGGGSSRHECCDVFGNTSGDYVNGASKGAGDISQDPLFASLEFGNLHIQPGSPCRDVGKTVETSYLQLAGVDVDGQQRVFGSAVDIGADESMGEIWPGGGTVLNVGPAASPGAMSLRDALAQAVLLGGADIRVAGGGAPLEAGVHVGPFTRVSGGYPAGANAKFNRNPRAFETVLDGKGVEILGVSCAPCTTLDGITVKGCNHGVEPGPLMSRVEGCKIIAPTICVAVRGGSPVISDSIVWLWGLISWTDATAVYCGDASPVLTNNVIGVPPGAQFSCDRTGVLAGALSGVSLVNNVFWNIWTGVYRQSFTPVTTLTANVFSNCCHPYFTYASHALPPGNTVGTPSLTITPSLDVTLKADDKLCINRGRNDAPGLSVLDYWGKARVWGGLVDIGPDEFWPEAIPVADLKSVPEGAAVLNGKAMVTAVFPGFFYITTFPPGPARSGIRVDPLPVASPGVGSVISITGAVRTNLDAERYISADSVSLTGNTSAPPPLVMAQHALGGGPDGLQPGVWRWQWLYKNGGRSFALAPCMGVNNIGTLARIFGRVTDGGWFVRDGWPVTWLYVDDGSAVQDGSGGVGVYCEATGQRPLPAVGTWGDLTGISSCEMYSGHPANIFRIRDGLPVEPESAVSAASKSASTPVLPPRKRPQ